jgi:O-acetyl-ADP-ribose deacetylase (regulator of RNase III)
MFLVITFKKVTMAIIAHPYDNNSKTYNFFFHPLYHREIEMRVISIAINIFLTLLTLGFWQLPFWIINRLDNKKVEKWHVDQVIKKIDSSLEVNAEKNPANFKLDTLALALKKIEAIPPPICEIVLPNSLPLLSEESLSLPLKATQVEAEIHTTFGQTKIILKSGSVVVQDTEAVVNAANSNLLGGGGVDGEFWAQSGTLIVKDESNKIILQGKPREFLESQILLIKEKLENQKLETGGAVITRSINIPSPYIIYTAGPIGEYPELLKKAYSSCLNLLVANNLKTISFSCISQNIYGYSPKKAAPIVINLIRRFCEANLGKIKEIRLMMFTSKEWDAYSALNEFMI